MRVTLWGPSSVFWPVELLLVASGLLIIAFAIPLYRRRIPPNYLYGVRFASTLADSEVWYAINERGGRDLIAIGTLYLIAVLASFLFGGSWGAPVRVVGPVAFLVVAVVADAIILALASRRLLAQRRQLGATPPG